MIKLLRACHPALDAGPREDRRTHVSRGPGSPLRYGRDNRRVLPGLIGAACLSVFLAACSADTSSESVSGSPAVPTPPGQVDAPKAPATDQAVLSKQLKGFRSDELDFIGLTEGMNYDMAVANVRGFLKPDEPVEGNFSFTQKTEETGDKEPIITLLTAEGLMDDSLKAMQVKLISGTGDASDTLAAYGARIKCWRGSNQDKWGTQPCS